MIVLWLETLCQWKISRGEWPTDKVDHKCERISPVQQGVENLPLKHFWRKNGLRFRTSSMVQKVSELVPGRSPLSRAFKCHGWQTLADPMLSPQNVLAYVNVCLCLWSTRWVMSNHPISPQGWIKHCYSTLIKWSLSIYWIYIENVQHLYNSMFSSYQTFYNETYFFCHIGLFVSYCMVISFLWIVNGFYNVLSIFTKTYSVLLLADLCYYVTAVSYIGSYTREAAENYIFKWFTGLIG